MKQLKKRINRDLFSSLLPSFLGTHILDDILTFFVNAYIAFELGKLTDAVFQRDFTGIREEIIVIAICLVIHIAVEPLIFAFFSTKSVFGSIAFIRKLLIHYLHKPYTSIANNNAGDIPSRIDNDIMDFIRRKLRQTGNRIMLPVFLIYLFFIVRRYFPWYVLISFLATSTSYISPIVIRKITAKYDAGERLYNSEKGTLETELATEAYCVRSIKLEEKLICKVKESFDRFYKKVFLKKNKCGFITGTINDIFQFFSKIIIVIIGAVFLHNNMIRYGEIAAMLSLTGSMTVLLDKASNLITEKPVLRNLYTRLGFFYEPTELERETGSHYLPNWGESIVEGHNISMRYGDNLVLKDFSFSLPKEKITLLKGPNGSGKTTLIRLICGFESPSSGELSFSNERMGTSSFSSLSLASQDSILFRYIGPKENILPGCEDENVLRKIESYVDLFSLQSVENEQTTENLSGGESQKVKILRSFIKPSKLLILDEPENHLDSDSVDCIVDFVKHYNGSMLIVSHSDKFDKIADHVIEL